MAKEEAKEFRIVRPMLAADGVTVVNQIDLDAQEQAVKDGCVLVERTKLELQAQTIAEEILVEEEKVSLPAKPTTVAQVAAILAANGLCKP